MGRTKFVTDSTPLVEDNKGKPQSRFMEKFNVDGLDKQIVSDLIGGNVPKIQPLTKFKSEFAREVYYLARLGAKKPQLAEFFKVSERTIENWKVANPEFYEAYRQGTWMHSFEIMETFGKKATGYSYVEVEESQTVTRSGEVVPITKVIHKQQPPSDILLIFYLKTKFPEIWGDLNKIEGQSLDQLEVAKRIDPSKYTEEERNFLRSIAMKKIKETQGQAAR